MNPLFEKIRHTAAGFQEASIILAAAELDVFTAVVKLGNTASAKQLADTLQVDVRGITALLDALAAMELLNKKEQNYSVRADNLELLNSTSPQTMIPLLRHMACCQRRWTQLSFAAKNGEPPKPADSFLGAEEDGKSFIMGMNSIAVNLVNETVKSLQQSGVLPFPKENIRFIDIGGASGTYTAAFLDAMPEAEGTVFDLPVGIAAAKKRFIGSRYEPRVQLAAGDFTVDELPAGFDFAWLSAIIHQFDRSESKTMFQKIYRALNSCGKLAIRDFVLNPERTAPKAGVLFGVNMLVGTKTGRVYSFAEIKEDLEYAGFTNVQLAVPAETMSAVVVAQK
ncbi:MAG: hypothetical protein LBN39_04095 [Planctomycetaceae bacterium]|nr:hypothetical protein [Planctomycetaceae bacterium]